jgi:hypothetical protein
MASSNSSNIENSIDESKNKQKAEVTVFIESLGRKPTDIIIATDDGETNYEITLLDLVTKMATKMPRRFKSVPGFATNRYTLKSGNFIEYYLKGGQSSRGILTFSIFNKNGKKFDEGEYALHGDWQMNWDPSHESRIYKTYKTLIYAHTHVVGDIFVGCDGDGPDSVDTSIEPFKPKQQVQPVGLAIYKP